MKLQPVVMSINARCILNVIAAMRNNSPESVVSVFIISQPVRKRSEPEKLFLYFPDRQQAEMKSVGVAHSSILIFSWLCCSSPSEIDSSLPEYGLVFQGHCNASALRYDARRIVRSETSRRDRCTINNCTRSGSR